MMLFDAVCMPSKIIRHIDWHTHTHAHVTLNTNKFAGQHVLKCHHEKIKSQLQNVWLPTTEKLQVATKIGTPGV